MFGASEGALRRYQVAALNFWAGLRLARERGCAYHLSLMEGEEPYKLGWAPRKVPYHRMVLGPET